MMQRKLLFAGLFLILVVSGCTSKPTYSTDSDSTTAETETETKEVATLDVTHAELKNWDADADLDGIEVTIQPLNRDNEMVEVEGIINASAYSRKFDDEKLVHVKGDLIQEWKGVAVGKDYGFLGTTARLEFDDQIDEKVWLEVDFIYGGKTYSARKENVFDWST